VKHLVLDASVVIKWLFSERSEEEHTQKTLEFFDHIAADRYRVIQPAHWLAEVAAVLARLSPATAEDDIFDLSQLNFEELRTPEVFCKAAHLAIQLNHHMFDTLYHAVALSLSDTTLVTADLRYFRKAQARGSVILLDKAPAP